MWQCVDEQNISYCCTNDLEARRDKVSHRCVTNFIFIRNSCRRIQVLTQLWRRASISNGWVAYNAVYFGLVL